MSRLLFASWVVGALFTAAVFAEPNPGVPGVGPTGEIAKVAGDFQFTEGPAADGQGNLYFTDVRANKIHKVDAEGKLTTFMENSEGCNGLMFDKAGVLYACQGGKGRVVKIDVATKEVTPVAEQYDGKPFNRPNDLVVDSAGGVYFTDPMFGRGEAPQSAQSVYYVDKGGKVTRLISDLERPNGVLLSPDERTLYVLPSGTPALMAYPIESPGKIGEGKVLAELMKPEEGQPRGGDGLSVDTRGNVYLTVPALSGIQVVTPAGQTLGMIKFPEAPSNCCFGGKDMRTLYVTARTSLYAAPMEATGHRFGGK